MTLTGLMEMCVWVLLLGHITILEVCLFYY